ncbi:unnamed protein product, partial [marine sediment metagenome]
MLSYLSENDFDMGFSNSTTSFTLLFIASNNSFNSVNCLSVMVPPVNKYNKICLIGLQQSYVADLERGRNKP